MSKTMRCVITNYGTPHLSDKSFVLHRKSNDSAMFGIMDSPPTVDITEIPNKLNSANGTFARIHVILWTFNRKYLSFQLH